MGVWNDHRPKVMAFCVCTTALTLLIVSSVIFAGRLGEEVKLWYNVPLCQAQVDGAPAGAINFSPYFVSRPLGENGVSTTCPTGLTLADAQEVTSTVSQSFFNPGSPYTTFVYRSNGSDIYAKPSYLKMEVVGKFTENTADDWATATPTRGRKLLKGSSGSGGSGGSYSSGPSYRSRNGNYGYWGAGYYSHGRSNRYRTSRTPAVDSLTVVSVYSTAPIVGARVTATSSSFARTSNCGNKDSGCEYTITTPMTKDSMNDAKWTTPDPIVPTASYTFKATTVMKYSLNSTVCAAGTIAGAAPLGYSAANIACPVGSMPKVQLNGYPNMFIVFATDKTNAESIIGWVLIPISCVLLCCGTIGALACKWSFCPGGRSRSARGYRSPGSSASSTASSDIALTGTAMATNPMRTSLVQYPYPPETGVKFTRRDDDFTSLRSIYPKTAAHVDLTSNDVASVDGCDGLPALTSLRLNDNNLRSLQGLHGARNLLALEAEGNDLRSLAGLGGNPVLTYLHLANNDISALNCAAVPALRYLNLANNDMAHLTNVAEFFPGLTHLDVSNNELKTIQGLQMCGQLRGIDLSQNDLTNPHEILALAALPGLAVLDITGNDFPAAAKQQIRDAFAARPGFQLQS